MRYTKRRVEPAGYVGAELARDILLLTMTTKPARFVASCVRLATRRSESLEITRSDLEERLATWTIHPHDESSETETGR